MLKRKPIDAVVLWVDGSDPNWLKEKAKYAGQKWDTLTSECRYREWGVFKYWFRAIEKNMPWIRTVHLVTNGQLPFFINTECKKLHLVKHSDIMPEEYLPTFSAEAIEINIHRISGLSEQFIYFNDDMYIMKPMKEKEFFFMDLPRYEGLEALYRSSSLGDNYWHLILNDMAIVNKHYHKYNVLRNNFLKFYNLKYGVDIFRNILLLPWADFQLFTNRHLPMPFLKDFFEEVWKREPEICRLTTSHRFKDYQNINQYVFRYWGIASGQFHPIHTDGKAYHLAEADINEVVREILYGNYKMLCINDGNGIKDLEDKIRLIIEAFEKRFPEKSIFEK